MTEEELIEKYKKTFFKGLVQGVGFGIGYGFFSLFWNKYIRQIFVYYLSIPIATITDKK